VWDLNPLFEFLTECKDLVEFSPTLILFAKERRHLMERKYHMRCLAAQQKY
jgi:hypothetical protein